MMRTVVITEGILDCIAVERLRIEPNVVAVSTLSKRISDAQARKLIVCRENTVFTIMFDSVAKDHRIWADIKAAASRLKEMAPDICVNVAELKDKDPDTAEPRDIVAAIEYAKPYDTLSAIKMEAAKPRKKINYPDERRV